MRRSESVKGWEILLSTAGSARVRGSGRNPFRSFSWLEAHDPSSIDDILGTALAGRDRKAQLAVVGTLLAVGDALVEKAEAPSKRSSSTGAPPLNPRAQIEDATGARSKVAERSRLIPETGKTHTVELSSVRVLGATNHDEKRPMIEEIEPRRSEADHSRNKIGSEGTGPFGQPIPGSTRGNAAAGVPTGLRPQSILPRPSLPLGLRSLAVSLAERFVLVLVRIAGGDSVRHDAVHERSRTLGGAEHAGASDEGAAPTALAGFAAEASLALVRLCALVASGRPGSAEARDTAGEKGDLEETGRSTTEGAWNTKRREALGVIAALASESIPSLLALAEGWIGGGSLSGGELTASCYGTVLPAEPQYGEAQRGLGFGIMPSKGTSPGSWAARGIGGNRTSLAALVVRDLRDLLSRTEATSRHLREFEAARRRARERDGLEELQNNKDSGKRTGPSATSGELSDDESLMEYASWHLAETIPTIVESSLWPTGGFRGAVGGGKRGSAARLAVVRGAMEEIHSFDRRALEMAGIEPPAGVEEGMWVAVRKLCVGLGGLKPKDLRPRDEGSAADELAARTSDAMDTSWRKTGGGDAEDVISSTQGSLMRVLSCPKPEVQTLGGATLGWVMSRAPAEGKHARDSGDGEPAGGGGKAPTQAGDLSGLLMMLERGDSAGAAAAEVLKGLARVRPLEIVPQLICASRDAAASYSATDCVESSRSSRVHLTGILAGILGGVYRELRATASGGVLVETIANHLIERLGSGEMEVRTAARKGLVSMDPGWITPRLCEWLEANYLQRSEDKTGRKSTAGGPSGVGSTSASGSTSGVDESGRETIGGAGWQSQGRSAALQALGDLLVQGRDPPYALSALLDSLRIPFPNANEIPRHLAAVGPARAAAIAAKGLAYGVHAKESRGRDVRGGAPREGADAGSAKRDGLHDTGDHDDSGSSRLKKQVLSSLPLWARRIRERSRALSLSCRMRETATCEPRSSEPSSTALASDVLGSTRIPGEDGGLYGDRSATGKRALISDDLLTEERDAPAGILPRSRSPPAGSKPAQVASRTSKGRPNLFGDCLETIAIKTLAAPEDALPVRFFAVLAAATTAAPEAVAGDGTTSGCAQPDVEGGAGTSDEANTPGSEELLRGVVELLCKRMSRQECLTDALLQDESDAATDRVRNMLFARLAPLLLLKALPTRVLAAEDGQGVYEVMSASGDNFIRPPNSGAPLGMRKENSSGVTAFAEDFAHEPGGERMESATEVDARVSSGGRADPKEAGLDAVGEIDLHVSVGPRMEKLYELLWERISRVYEYDQVTKLAAEVCGKLPARVVFPATISRLVGFVEAEERARGISSGAHAPEATGEREDGAEDVPGGDDEALAATTTLAARGIFTICHAVSNHGELMEAWLASTLSAIMRILLLPATESGNLARVQQGGIDCLAVLLETSASVARDRRREGRGGHPDGMEDRPLVVEMDHGSIHLARDVDRTQARVVPASDGGNSVPGESFSADRESSNRERGISLDEMPTLLGAIVVEGVIPTEVLESSYLAASDVSKTEVRGENAERDESGGDIGRIRNGGCGGRNTSAPMQVRICAANAAVLATRRCPEEFLPTLCHHGNLLGNFLQGASRGSGLLRAACLQVMFAVVYRSPGVFARGWGADACLGSRQITRASSSRPVGYDDMMQIACDALDEGQGEEEVRVSGLKLILAVVAAGASSTGVVETNAASSASVSSRNGPPGLGRPSSSRAGDGVAVSGITAVGGGALRQPGDRVGGAGDQRIISPGMISRAKRLLKGVANMDTSSDARELAGRALEAIGGIV